MQMKKFIGEELPKDCLKNVESYSHEHLEILIPNSNEMVYKKWGNYYYPAYKIGILLACEEKVDVPRKHYLATICSPQEEDTINEMHCDHYYLIMIEPNFFEAQYKLYQEEIPKFKGKQFAICADVVKAVNTYAFECSKTMPNKAITLSAQEMILTHWIIRSVLGEDMDMRAVSGDYTLARVQHYIEKHYGESLTIAELAKLNNLSVSTFERLFKKEMGVSPMQYLLEVRLNKAKLLLGRTNMPLTEIANQCGFSSSAHLGSTFKSATGATPSEFRKAYKG